MADEAPQRNLTGTIRGIGMRGVRIYDEQDHRVDVDPVEAGITAISTIQRQTNAGVAYTVTERFAAVGAGSTVDILFQVPESVIPFVRFAASCSADVDIDVYEGTTFSNAGNIITPTNLNRLSPFSSPITVSEGATITDLGTPLFGIFIPGGSGGNAPGGTAGGFEQIILANNQNYLAEFTNRGGSAVTIGGLVTWYELPAPQEFSSKVGNFRSD